MKENLRCTMTLNFYKPDGATDKARTVESFSFLNPNLTDNDILDMANGLASLQTKDLASVSKTETYTVIED